MVKCLKSSFLVRHSIPVLICIYVLLAINAPAQVKWSGEQRVTWANFKGAPNETGTNKALSNISLGIQYNCNNRCIYYRIEAIFNEHTSWVAVPSDILLEHERNHFDIQELFARRIRKYLMDSWRKGIKEDIIHAQVDHLAAECKRFQESYDIETDHSRNGRRQKAWGEKIWRELELLKEFSEAEVSRCRD